MSQSGDRARDEIELAILAALQGRTEVNDGAVARLKRQFEEAAKQENAVATVSEPRVDHKPGPSLLSRPSKKQTVIKREPCTKACPVCKEVVGIKRYNQHLHTHRAHNGRPYRETGPRSISIDKSDQETKDQFMAVHAALGLATYRQTMAAIIEGTFIDLGCSYLEGER